MAQPEEAFHWRRKAQNERHSNCKACVNAKNKLAWEDNDRHGKKARTDLRREANKQIMLEAKNMPCKDCGVQFPSVCMDFDHRDPSEKLFTIAQCGGTSKERLLKEIAKCDVVCSNCHRIRTHIRRN